MYTRAIKTEIDPANWRSKVNAPDPAEASVAHRPVPPLLRKLTSPWADRVIAILAAAPFAWYMCRLYQGRSSLLTWQLLFLEAEYVLIIVTTVFRRPPKRVTPNPLFWLLAFVATYWGLLILGFVQPGRPLAPYQFSNSLTVLGSVIVAWARISLGRNIGYVPAQREIVSRGAYNYVRHPIYTGIYISYLAAILRLYTPRNAALFVLGCFWFVIKSLVEENFLKTDPQYAAYMHRVRARWIPFLI
jgi:protein-S-isoprenylcysteine O-methyltransferase Ste14